MTNPDYREAARFQLWFAKMEQMRGNAKAASAHRELADIYVKQELRKHRSKRAA